MKNNEYEAMNVRDICEISMDKIYKHLRDFFEEAIGDNINKDIIKEIDKKYNRYKKNNIIKNDVNNSISNIFDENKSKSIEKFVDIINDKNNEATDCIDDKY